METAKKPGLFKRLWQKLDNSMKEKAKASSSSCCCEDEDGNDKGSGKCC